MTRIFITGILAFVLSCFTLHAQDIPEWIERIDAYVNQSPDSALKLCDEALKGKLGHADRALLNTIRGNAYFTLGDSESAVDALSKAVDEARSTRDTMIWVNALSDLGVVYRVSQQPDSALACYILSLELLEGRDEPLLESNILTSIAVLFANSGRPAEGVPFARKGVEKARVTGDLATEIYASSTLGSALFLAGEHERGLEVESGIVRLAERHNVPRYTLKTYASIAAMHRRLGNTDSVRHYISLGEKLLPKVPEGSVEAVGFMEQSWQFLAEMGRYRESLDMQERILKMKDSKPFMPLDALMMNIARNYHALGDIDKMAEAYERSIEIADSLHQSDIDDRISELNVKYQSAEKELEIARLESDRLRQRIIICIVLAILVFVVSTGLLFYKSIRRRNELANIRSRLEGIEQERGRLSHELHDGVCNDLLGIELMAVSPKADKEEVIDMLRVVRDEVRSISHELLPPRFGGVTLGQLLEAYADKNSGLVTFVDSSDTGRLNAEQSVNLYRIVQEWVGNIRRHGNATHVSIDLSEKEHEMMLRISDNGAAMTVGVNKIGGIGMSNIGRRVKALGGDLRIGRIGDKNELQVIVPL